MIEISSLCQFKALNDRSVIVIADLSYNQWLIDRDWSKLESPDRDKSTLHPLDSVIGGYIFLSWGANSLNRSIPE